ncbi:protein phosphatase PTC7 homolog fig [Drosophila ficusphila]|uniref:protein phosphatase PTC7 homolog fig n=1 Tax=Drosophila ficusphila TaxID=30025 RepID=UPI0007E7CB96|nr:protein phosphatase PTC7 homolog fig [Drosophila ficusphila]
MMDIMSCRLKRWPYLLIRIAQQLRTPLQIARHSYHQLNHYYSIRSLQSGVSRRSIRDPYLTKVVQGRSKKPRYPGDQRANQRFGEDSWFLSSTPLAEVMGVADGVGGWRDMGVDAGRFAKELMSCCSGQTELPSFDGRSARDLLIAGYRDLVRKENPAVGSSTACLVSMHRKDCTLYTANLGDSGFMVVRNGRVLHRSEEQTHDFNTPYQLAVPPKGKGDNFYFDKPEMAESTRYSLQPGDLVLLATDGLFDNLPESMLLKILNGLKERGEQDLQKGANQVVEKARELSLNANFQSPFAIKAREHNVLYSGGGKPDDITLILASVEVPKA